MKYQIAKPRDIYLGNTSIENVFINESMPSAPGDFVKVYLYARLYGELRKSISDEDMAKQLGITTDRILEAWDYWEDNGVIKKLYLDKEGKLDYTVEFLSIREELYGAEMPEEEGEDVEPLSVFGSEAIREMMKKLEKKLGRTMSPGDLQTVLSWVEELKMPPEVIEFAAGYSMDKNKPSIKYIGAILESWSEKGLRTVDSAEAYLGENDKRHYDYRRVMKALGFSRNPTEEEMRIMNTWFDDMGFNLDKVLEACSATANIPNPNIKYVNGVLSNWQSDAEKHHRGVNEKKPVSQAVLNKYYSFLRDKAEKEADERRREIYTKLPEVEKIDDEIRSLGAELSRELILKSSEAKGRELTEKMERLSEDRAIILAENNFDIDYTEIRYRCPMCNDTGITDMGERCVCIEQCMQEAEEWENQKKKA